MQVDLSGVVHYPGKHTHLLELDARCEGRTTLSDVGLRVCVRVRVSANVETGRAENDSQTGQLSTCLKCLSSHLVPLALSSRLICLCSFLRHHDVSQGGIETEKKLTSILLFSLAAVSKSPSLIPLATTCHNRLLSSSHCFSTGGTVTSSLAKVTSCNTEWSSLNFDWVCHVPSTSR